MSERDDKAQHPLIEMREFIESGQSVYGDPQSAAARRMLEELGARIDLGRELGEVPPEGPDIATRVRQERLAAEFPGGDPGADPAPELEAFWHGQLDQLDQLDQLEPRQMADRVADVAKTYEFTGGTSAAALRHAAFDLTTDTYKTGKQIVEASSPMLRRRSSNPAAPAARPGCATCFGPTDTCWNCMRCAAGRWPGIRQRASVSAWATPRSPQRQPSQSSATPN